MLRSCAIIFLCLAVAELIVGFSGIRLPSALIGMLLLVALLKAGWVRLEWVKSVSDFLLTNLGLFFVPPGVALMLHFDLIRDELLPIATATLISTVAVLAVTGWVYQLARGRR